MSGSAVAEATVGLAVELVRTDSVDPGLVSGATGEAEVAGLLARRLKHCKFDVQVVPVGGAGKASLVARHTETGRGRRTARAER